MLITGVVAVAAAGPGGMWGSIGLEPSLAALRTSARHQFTPALGLWAGVAPRPWAVTGELMVTRQAGSDGEHYRYVALGGRADVVGEWAIGSHATAFHVGAGPALGVRDERFEADGLSAREWAFDPGLRVRVALEGPLSGKLAFCWHLGATTRGPGVDWDVGLGLGIPR
jgi:hypothetical protein